MRNCGRPGGVSGLLALQLAFSHTTLVRLTHAFYPIFKLAVSRTQDEGPCAALRKDERRLAFAVDGTPGRRPREPSPGSELAPWERVLSE
jgi:hypothetical protein